MNQKGFSLTELIITMGIMGALLAIATLPFNNWVKKAGIESQTRILQSDLNNARIEAVTSKTRRSIVLNPESYSYKSYTSANENTTSGGKVIFTKVLNYQIAPITGSFTDRYVVFDTRGFVEIPPYPTVRALPSYSGAAFDCIVISVGRNNIGKVEKVSGNDKCVPK